MALKMIASSPGCARAGPGPHSDWSRVSNRSLVTSQDRLGRATPVHKEAQKRIDVSGEVVIPPCR